MTQRPLLSPRSGAIAAAFAILMCIVTPAYGQPLFDRLDSIEWMAADSSLIVRGTIEALSTEKELERGLWHTMRFRVQETLKGEHQPSVQFVMQSNDVRREIELIDGWKSRGESLLVFLCESKCLVAHGNRKYARYDFAPRTGYRDRSIIALKFKSENPVLTLALRLLSKPEDIIAATKSAIAFPTNDAKVCSHSYLVPRDLVENTQWVQTGGGVRLSVPIDARLEAQAHKWIESQAGEMRATEAEALLYFRTDENAAVLKGLLDDPFALHHTEGQGHRVVRRERTYRVREAASNVLDAWGHNISDVVTREPLPLNSNH